ncbi:MAG: tRNA (adenosine(37)-N6)-threonylcarbamoyltransferase complex transferase subunit TsaD [bacterium]|nr:tRNA (adenosine(37)-N6)-threonylcarbamoyltransferase complex transferase subunit TsaD [bacterium]
MAQRILAIETSCDETAIAVAEFSGTKAKPGIRVLSHLVSSQVALHAKFGGVVPNLTRREHQRSLVPLLIEGLREAGMLKLRNGAPIEESRITHQESGTKSNPDPPNAYLLIPHSVLGREPELLEQVEKHVVALEPPAIDAIAVTYGPGLAPALWVGVNFAKALAALWNKPLIPINHMAGHIYSAVIHDGGLISLRFPVLALLVSGGHTELVLMRGHGKYEILGETLDDAAGEAFDKVARLLGLGYPGGPEIARLAAQPLPEGGGVPSSGLPRPPSGRARNDMVVHLPRPMLHSKDYDFSFSGLKTAVLYTVRALSQKHSIKKLQPVVAKAFQDAAVEVLVTKTIRAAKEYNVKTVLVGGGVAANAKLREDLGAAIAKELPGVYALLPEPSMTGDNALMIALAAFFAGKKVKSEKIEADANLRLS